MEDVKTFKTDSKALFDMFTFNFTFTDSQLKSLQHFYKGNCKSVEIKYFINGETYKVLELNLYGGAETDS
jgi:hypothetical protein